MALLEGGQAEQVAEQYGVDVAKLLEWRDAFVSAGKNRLAGPAALQPTGSASDMLMRAGLRTPGDSRSLNPLAHRAEAKQAKKGRNDARRDSTNYFGLSFAYSGHGFEGQVDSGPDQVAHEQGLETSLRTFSDHPKHRLAVELGHRNNNGKFFTEYGVMFDSHEVDAKSADFGTIHLDRDDLAAYGRLGYWVTDELGVSVGGHVTATKANVHYWWLDEGQVKERHDQLLDWSVGPSASITYKVAKHVEASCSAYFRVGDMDIVGKDPIYTCGIRVTTD
jgi:hypothetical protein